MTTNISILSLQTVLATVQPNEDFAPPPLLFFESDGVTPIDLTGINFTVTIGSYPALTSAAGGAITVSGNSLTFFVPAAQKNWATGKYSFYLTGTDGTYTRDIFANSTLTVGQPASFSVSPYAATGSSDALSNLSGAALLALVANMPTSQQQSLYAELLDAQASCVPSLDFSHVVNSQFIGSTPFLFTVG